MACLQRYELPLPSAHMLGSPMTRTLSGSRDEEAAALLLGMSLGVPLEQVRTQMQSQSQKLPVLQPPLQPSMPMVPVSFPLSSHQFTPNVPPQSSPKPQRQDIPLTFHNITLPSNRTKVSTKTQQCANCGTTETPVWRNGETLPDGTKRHLCNACGLRWKRCQAL